MRRGMPIYFPAILLIVIALALPTSGRDWIGRMNAHEFALLVGIWWMILAVGFRVALGVYQGLRRPKRDPEGFAIIEK